MIPLRGSVITLLVSFFNVTECLTMTSEVVTLHRGRGISLNYSAQASDITDSVLACSCMCKSKPCCLTAIFDEFNSTCVMYDVGVHWHEVDKEDSVIIQRQWDQGIVHHRWADPIPNKRIQGKNTFTVTTPSFAQCQEICFWNPYTNAVEYKASKNECRCQSSSHLMISPVEFDDQDGVMYSHLFCAAH
ncbi:hypothetical protein CAPTEDRAFT_202847 [Capitella teleta]|uniref:Apple domain-containing protein n=1 Tax=Capitella teleta TaxID=283909 RepID=R7V8L1_CAPTE|nr:hypothetical protein CAPTEDRAFT_202847 [Capitella teleta]|eukprot:ELU15163.1 hypothetical protein CAPTEDRAFT_202847 [Capitella teleta]